MRTRSSWRRLLLLLLLAVLAVSRLAAAQLPADGIELDLVFPRAGGRYAETDEGLPVLLSLQNPDVAYHHGWVFSWDVYKKPHAGPPPGRLPSNTIGSRLKNDTTYPENPHLEVAYTGRLDAGDYTFSWTMHTGPWCEVSPSSVEYASSVKVANGTFDFAVDPGAPTPTFTGACPTALGMISYAGLTTYHGLYGGKYDDDDDDVDDPSAVTPCAVTASVTVTPEPCRATVNAAEETSISSRLRWGTYATAATAPAGPSTSSAGSSSSSSLRRVWGRAAALILGLGLYHGGCFS